MLTKREMRLALVVEVETQSLAGLRLGHLLDIEAVTDTMEADLAQGWVLPDKRHKLVQFLQRECVQIAAQLCKSCATWRIE